MTNTFLLNRLQGKTYLLWCNSNVLILEFFSLPLLSPILHQGDAVGAECLASHPWTCPCPNTPQVSSTSAYCVRAPCICCSNHAEGKRVLGTFTWTRWTSHPQGTNPTVWLLRHQQGRVHQRIPSWQTNDLFVLSLLPANSSGWQGNPLCFVCSTFSILCRTQTRFLFQLSTHACLC